MKTPLLLVACCLVLTVMAAAAPAAPAELTLIALCALFAALVLALSAWWRGTQSPSRQRGGKPIAVDGSNLLYWQGDKPQLATVAQILRQLEEQGRHPKIWFDANVGYLVAERYLNAEDLARMLKIDRQDVIIAPKGQPADPLILQAALRRGMPVLSNDRYRDWHEAFPGITAPGALLQGRLSNGQLRLDPAFAQKPERATPKNPLSIPGERRATQPRPGKTEPESRRREPRF